MKPHIVQLSDFSEMLETHETLMAQSTRVHGGSKSLKQNMQGVFVVRDGKQIVYCGHLNDAIDVYNELY